MKKYLSLLVVFVMIFALGTGVKIAKAEGETLGDNTASVSSENKVSDLKQGLMKEKEQKEGKLKEIKKKIRNKVANGLIHRTENLSNITDRIKSRIEKLKALSVDTTKAEELVVKAEESITLAKTNIIKVQVSIENGDTLEVIKTNIVAVKDALKQTHTYLSQAVQELKMKMAEKKTDAASTGTNQ